MLNDALYDFMSRRKQLIWYVKDLRALDERSVVEHVLNYGNWRDFQKLISILGIKKIAEIFREQVARKRKNYRKEVVNYFRLYFDKHAS